MKIADLSHRFSIRLISGVIFFGSSVVSA